MRNLLFVLLTISILAIPATSFALFPVHPEATFEAVMAPTVEVAPKVEKPRGSAEALSVMVVAFDLNDKPLKEQAYLDIVKECVVDILSSSEGFKEVVFATPAVEIGKKETLSEYQGLAQDKGMDILFVINMGKVKGPLNQELDIHLPHEPNPYQHLPTEVAQRIASNYAFSMDVFSANTKAISLLSGKVFICGYIQAESGINFDVYENIKHKIKKYAEKMEVNLPLKKGEIIGMTKDAIKITLCANDGLVSGESVYLFSPNSNHDIKSKTNLLGFQTEVRAIVSEVTSGYSFIKVVEASKADEVREGWIVEAFVKTGEVTTEPQK